MEIKSCNSVRANFGGDKTPQTKNAEIKPKETKTTEASALDCLAAQNAASIKRGDNKYSEIDEALSISDKILENGEKIKRPHLGSRNGQNVVSYTIGDPIEGFSDLLTDKKRATCYFDEEGKRGDTFVWNKETDEIDVYDKDGNKIHHYTKEEKAALKYYKYQPKDVHALLREDRKMYSGSFLEDTKRAVSDLEQLFSNPDKMFTTDRDLTLYRALQDNLSDEEIETLSTLGATYTDKSYVSTTLDYETALRFARYNPIMEIKFPKGSKFMDVERLFNIDRTHWSENELLLDKNSSFKITGFDYDNNIIKAEYTGG